MRRKKEKENAKACRHLTGYWINKRNGNFRCYVCGAQFHLIDLPQRKRDIEDWIE